MDVGLSAQHAGPAEPGKNGLPRLQLELCGVKNAYSSNSNGNNDNNANSINNNSTKSNNSNNNNSMRKLVGNDLREGRATPTSS